MLLVGGGATALASVGVTRMGGVAAAAGAGQPDAWSSPITWRATDGWYSVPIHATLLPDRRVLLMGIDWPKAAPTSSNIQRRSAFAMLPPPIGTPLGAELIPTRLDEPLDATDWVSGGWQVDDSLFCSGHTLTADGRLFSVGGTRTLISPPSTGADVAPEQEIVTGLSYATSFDGRSWTRVPNAMQAAGSGGGTERWYPTVTRLPDARLLVTSGFELVVPNPQVNLTAEIYAPATGTWSVISEFGKVPFEIFSSDYSHAFTLPTPVGSNDVLLLGEPGLPVLTAATANAAWNISAPPRPGSEAFQNARRANGGAWQSAEAPNNGAATAMLPIRVNDGDLGYSNGSVIVVGGARQSSFERAIDVYDPRRGTWRNTIATQAPRHYPAIVLLPDSRVLVVSGASTDPNSRHAEYVDPLAGFASISGGSQVSEVRGYHNVAMLLPDGSVLVGGGRDVDRDASLEKPTFRYYYPYYVFADRPRITTAPTSLVYNTQFIVQTTGLLPADMLLIALGSMTHCFDFNQRVVQLKLLSVTQTGSGQYQSTLLAPLNTRIAPPGHYMLFAVDGRRIPSEAAILRVNAPAGSATLSPSSPSPKVTGATSSPSMQTVVPSALRRAADTTRSGFSYTCPIIGPVKPD